MTRYGPRPAGSARLTLLGRILVSAALALLVAVGSPAMAQVCAVPGADGPVTVTGGVVNTYFPAVASASAGATSIQLGTGRGTTAISAGDLLLVIQMQDATLDSSDTDSYGDGIAGEPASGATSLGGAGRYEYAVAAASVPLGGGTLQLRGPLSQSFAQAPASLTQGQRTFQVVRVPQYSNVAVTGVVRALHWDGGSGGIVALDVASNLAFSGAGGVDVKGLGFRGGAAVSRPIADGNGTVIRFPFASPVSNGIHASKGEGVAGTPRLVHFDSDLATLDPGVIVDTLVEGYPGGALSRGAPGTAGGGGAGIDNSQHDNGGGGGGANGGAGGRGGIGFAINPAFYATHLGGFGGAAFAPASAARLVLGGGGGAGDTNGNGDPTYSHGSSGGGIVMIRAGTISGGATINADGQGAPFMFANDGAGGAGAGGSVLVITQAGPVGSLVINARGGLGGESHRPFTLHGPGGGGGGGVVVTSGAATIDVAGGPNGLTGPASTDHGATPGAAGLQLLVTASGDSPTAAAGARCLPVLTATKSTSTPTRAFGVDTTATYSVALQNPSGGGTAYGVAITDDLPAPFTYDGAAVTPAYSPAACGTGPATVTGAGSDPAVFGTPGGDSAAAFTIPGGCTVSLTFNVNLNGAALGTYENPAAFSFADPTRAAGGTAAAGGNPVVAPGDPYAAGGTVGGTNYLAPSTTNENVTIAPASADLSLTKTVAPAAALIGQNVTFTVTVSNAGPNAAAGVVVRDLLPPGYTFVSATPASGAFDVVTGLWSGLTLASGTSSTLVLVATVNPVGPYANTAEVFASATADPDSTPNNSVAGEDDIATATPVVSGTGFTALVFNDLNGNGTQDGGEGGIGGVQVLVTDGTGAVRTLTTNAGGTATAQLPPGSTTIDIVEASLPAGAALTAGTDPRTLTIVAGTPASTVTGFQVRGSLTGRAFRDSNGNGVLDAGEPGIGNLPVVITTVAAQTLNVVTDAAGDYSAVVPAGLTVARASDLAGFTVTTANNPQNVTVAGGVTTNAAPVGLAPFATVTGTVWRDLDSDRVRDTGEPGLAGWRVDLVNVATGVVAQTATTTATGQYTIANVVPAATYRVRYTAPNGAVFGVGVNGENGNPQANSAINAAERSLDITPQPGITLAQQSLPVDPQGIVYDTVTRQALAGARVSITGPAGFNPAAHLLGGAANATQTTGPDGFYQFLLLPAAPAGAYALAFTAPTGYLAPSAFLPPSGTLDPTGQGINGVLRVQAQSTPPTSSQPFTYYLSFALAPGDPDVVNNHVPLDPAALAGGAIRLSKRADRVTAVAGGLVTYTITLENTSSTRLPGMEIRDTPPAGFTLVDNSVRLDGSATGLTVRGPRPLVFSGIDLSPGQRRVLRYVMRVGAGVVRGEYPNTASPFLLGGAVGNADTARVAVVADPTFDETTVIGKVFDDQDGDGWQDEGEKGIPGVRVATVEGLIAETDAFGRYHFAAIDGGFMERGRNFIVKLDESTLPPGSTVETENPRVARITPGMLGRFDFGVKLARLEVPGKRIDLKLAEIYFTRDGAELAPEFLPRLAEIADRVRSGEKAKVTVKVAPPSPEGCSPACQLGRRRIDSVRRALQRLLGPEGLKNVEVVADYTAAGGVALNHRIGGWARETAYAVLALLAPAAHAAPCPAGVCETQPVEVRAKYERVLADPGRFWATEDPTAVEPRLAVEGPDRLPVANGLVDSPAQFAIYTNYSMFVERYEIVIHRGDDTDRSRPLGVVPVKFLPSSLRNLLAAQWSPSGAAVDGADELVFVVRAYGRDGAVDETAPRRIQLVSRREFEAQRRLAEQAQSRGALEDPAGESGAATGVASTALKGKYLLMRPGSVTLVDAERRVGVEATAGLAAAESAIQAGVPLEQMGLAGTLPPPFTRKSLLAELGSLEDSILQVLYGRSDLARRAIPVHGSRVRVVGRDIGDSVAVRLNGQVVPVDVEGRLAYEALMPVGSHEVFLDLVPASGDVWPLRLAVEVTGRHLFMVGLADLTWQNNDVAGSIEPLSADDRYLEESLTEGRVALYLKGKIRGKYLLTTQLDSREEQLDEIVDNIDQKDPRRLFRSIDPDQYYPVYGDDSTTIADTNTQGRLYARLDWDNSRAVLGNFNTNFTGNEFAQYNRALYGASLAWHGLESTSDGESKTNLDAFVSEVQTALGHDEFLGTGGSLYYLRHTDVVEGSAKARIEIIDRVTERTLENITLVEGVDYELDELQGRVILAKPLAQVARQRAPYLVRDQALEGNRVLLVMDYEYLPAGFADDAASFGVRGKKWLGDHVALGGTWVDESRDTQDYRLGGADLTLQAGRGSYVKFEYAQTEATQSARYYSTDGGLSFAALNPLAAQSAADDRSGEAFGVEARMNLRERGLTRRDTTIAAWWNRTDEQFAVARRDEGFDVDRSGLEAIAALSDRVRFAARATTIERDGLRPGQASSVDQVSAQVAWDATDRDRLSTEVQYLNQSVPATAAEESTVAAVEYRRVLTDDWQAWAIAQAALDDGGRDVGNDLYTFGSRYRFGGAWAIDAEASSGDRGDGLQATLEYQRTDDHTLYGTFSHSVDRTDEVLSSNSTFSGQPGFGTRSDFYDNAGNTVALGSRWQLSDQTRVFNEAQFVDSPTQAGLGHVFGLEFSPRTGWRYGLSLQKGEFATQGGATERDAVSGSVGYAGRRLNWSTRLEYRADGGVTEATQYLTSNRVDFKLRDSFRLLGKLNWSRTEQDVARLNDGRLFFGQAASDAQFAEASLGLAYRPVDGDRFNWLARVTYLYDLTSFAQTDSDRAGEGVTSLLQSGRTDQKSLVGSWEGVLRLTPKFDLGGKLARRTGEVRLDRSVGDWIDSTANFAAVRASYELIHKWDAMLEYRWLDVPDAGSTRQGFLVSIDREIKRNFKIGIGYNFTDFSDELTNLDYEFQGVFVNVVGKY
jgi:uncharacterized repeat protein (TIGR01451 family)